MILGSEWQLRIMARNAFLFGRNHFFVVTFSCSCRVSVFGEFELTEMQATLQTCTSAHGEDVLSTWYALGNDPDYPVLTRWLDVRSEVLPFAPKSCCVP